MKKQLILKIVSSKHQTSKKKRHISEAKISTCLTINRCIFMV